MFSAIDFHSIHKISELYLHIVHESEPDGIQNMVYMLMCQKYLRTVGLGNACTMLELFWRAIWTLVNFTIRSTEQLAKTVWELWHDMNWLLWWEYNLQRTHKRLCRYEIVKAHWFWPTVRDCPHQKQLHLSLLQYSRGNSFAYIRIEKNLGLWLGCTFLHGFCWKAFRRALFIVHLFRICGGHNSRSCTGRLLALRAVRRRSPESLLCLSLAVKV